MLKSSNGSVRPNKLKKKIVNKKILLKKYILKKLINKIKARLAI
jgi:hypothetical protein